MIEKIYKYTTIFVLMMMGNGFVHGQYKLNSYKIIPGTNTQVKINNNKINIVELFVQNNRDQKNVNFILNSSNKVELDEKEKDGIQVFIGYTGLKNEFLLPVTVQVEINDIESIVNELYTKGLFYYDVNDDVHIIYMSKNGINGNVWENIFRQLDKKDNSNALLIIFGDKSDVINISRYCEVSQTTVMSIGQHLNEGVKYAIYSNSKNDKNLKSDIDINKSSVKISLESRETEKEKKKKERDEIKEKNDGHQVITEMIRNAKSPTIKEKIVKQNISVSLRLEDKQNKYKNIFSDNYKVYLARIKYRDNKDSVYNALNGNTLSYQSNGKNNPLKEIYLESIDNSFNILSFKVDGDSIVATIRLKEKILKLQLIDVKTKRKIQNIKGFDINIKYKNESLFSVYNLDTLLLPTDAEYSIEFKHKYYFTVKPEGLSDIEREGTIVRISNQDKITIPIYLHPKEGTLKLRCEMVGRFRSTDIPEHVYVVSSTVKRRIPLNNVIKLSLVDGFDEPFRIELDDEYRNHFRLSGKYQIPGLQWNKIENETEFYFTIERILTPKKLPLKLLSEVPMKNIPVHINLSWDNDREKTNVVLFNGIQYDTTILWPNWSDSISIDAEKIPFLHYILDDDWKSQRFIKKFLWKPEHTIEIKMVKQTSLQVVYVDVSRGMMPKNNIISSLNVLIKNVKAIKNNVNDIVLFVSNGVDRYYANVNSDDYESMIGRYEPLPPKIFSELKYLYGKIKSGVYGQKRIERLISVYLSSTTLDMLLAMNRNEFIMALNDADVYESDQFVFYIEQQYYNNAKDHFNLRDNLLFGRYPIRPIKIDI